MLRKLALFAVMGLCPMLMVGCAETDTAADSATEAVDDAAAATEDAMEDTAEAVEDEVDAATDGN